MKTKTIFWVLFLFPGLVFTQKKVAFGINMGFNFNRLELEKDLSLGTQIDELTTEGTIGFHIGVHSLISVANRVKLAPQAMLAFSSMQLGIDFGNDEPVDRNMENVQIRLPVDLHLELLTGATSLYLIGGVEYSLDITEGDALEETQLSIKDGFWSARLGLGLRKDFARFSMSPELTFNRSFDSIEEDERGLINQVITNLDNSIVGLNLKFQGLLSE